MEKCVFPAHSSDAEILYVTNENRHTICSNSVKLFLHFNRQIRKELVEENVHRRAKIRLHRTDKNKRNFCLTARVQSKKKRFWVTTDTSSAQAELFNTDEIFWSIIRSYKLRSTYFTKSFQENRHDTE